MALKTKPFFRRFLHCSLFSLLALSYNAANAGIYKWVDAQGNVHYSQQRPTTTSSEKMQVQKYAPENTSTYNRPGTSKADKVSSDTAENKPAKTSEPEKKVETKAEKKQRLAGCAEARKRLSTMESIGRVRSKDKDGNYSYLSQKEKEARMGKNKNLIAKHCK